MSTAPSDQSVKTDMGRRFTLIALRMITVGMFFLFGMGLLFAIQRFSPATRVDYLPFYCALFAIEAIFTYTRTRSIEGRERALFRASELVTFAILLKIFLLLGNPTGDFSSILLAWQNDFFASFFDGAYMTHLIIFLAVWGITTYMLDLFDQLHERELDATWEDPGKLSNSLKHIRSQMSTVLVAMLIFLMAVTTLSSVGIHIPDLISYEASGIHPAWVVMLFAVLLMIQFSLTQFILLRSRWDLDRAAMSRQVPRQWLVYGLVFLTIIGVLVILLPTRYTVSFFDMLAGLVSLLSQVFGLLIYLITLPFILLMRLFSGGESTAVESPSVEMPQIMPDAASPLHLPPIFEIIRVVIFWGAFLLIIGFALYQFASANKDIWKSIAGFPLVRWLGSLFRTLRTFFARAGQVVQQQIKRIQLPGLRAPNLRSIGSR
ncbi:MAG TPA: hypothetical protein PJ988_21755, partial [Anaerolinea sp.]|nr:hypothetical protein [Anaerolinea sp.]